MPLRLTNTLSREKETFVPIDEQRVTMYTCGPTVYAPAHIGNARPAVVSDVLFRLLRRIYGPDHVVYATNITDIDDRIIASAVESGRPLSEVTAEFETLYRSDMAALGMLEPTHRPRATAHVGGMIDLMTTLERKGLAYRTSSGLLFHVPAWPEYGKLSRRNRDDMIAGARVDVAADKRDPADFSLWKAAKPDEPEDAVWDSPWGPGRPGWHIECSAMAKALLGATIDIHIGGIDLVFPHHENEIAQSESANGAPLARYWLHNGFLSMDAEKMSKSLGNVRLVHDLLTHHRGETLRFALLTAHYRQPLDWTDALLAQSKATLDRLYNALRRTSDLGDAVPAGPSDAFLEALHDDLNTPEALAELSRLAGEANKGRPAEQARARTQLLAAGALVGLLQEDPDEWARGDAEDAARIDALVAERIAARKARDFARADALRDQLAAEGVEVMDGPSGSTWRRL